MIKCASLLVAASVAVLLAGPPQGFAQPLRDSAPVTGMKPDRVTAPRALREAMQKREAVKRQKRAECRAQAKAEKVPLWRRPAYVKGCTMRAG